MYEDIAAFHAELRYLFARSNDDPTGHLHRWHTIEARYPELLANWLTSHPEFKPPDEVGIRIGKRADHLQGGRRNA